MKILLSIILVFAGIESPKSTDTFYGIYARALYFGAAVTFESTALLARLGYIFCLIHPWSLPSSNEWLLLNRLCEASAYHAFIQAFRGTSIRGIPPSQFSWYLNRAMLSQILTSSDEEKQLVYFLKKRWLAKSTGFFSIFIDCICPCFEILLQVHPETTSTYARNPWNEFSNTYKNCVDIWKRVLPHPEVFPLILTRPFNIHEYLPSYVDISEVPKGSCSTFPLIIDVTNAFPAHIKGRETWLHFWKKYQGQLIQMLQAQHVDINQILCIQRVKQESMGGIRLLPFDGISREKTDEGHRYLLEWISMFGLTASRIELDRLNLTPTTEAFNTPLISLPIMSKDKYITYFDRNKPLKHPQKAFMVEGILQILTGLLTSIPQCKWDKINSFKALSSIAQLSFLEIKEKLRLLAQGDEKTSFFDATSYIEQIHAHLSSLIEIFAPFTHEDFSSIYRDDLNAIPASLKPLMSCALHASGMTNVAGIFKAVEKMHGTSPRVLYGENTYFECIQIAHRISNASSIEAATEEDKRNADLILAQFNPALKRTDLPITEYNVEKVIEAVDKVLSVRHGRPLTLALDCTLDFIDSPRVGQLLNTFQKEIRDGILNVICYRSGLKFDLFGMDNYSGAPIYMIHNKDPKWNAFDMLLRDPVLQADLLSLNWFCLAYKYAAPQLEQYRRQIFDNTRALLNKIPFRLFDKNSAYHVVHVDEKADASFLDIKITGPLHQLRGAALAGGCLFMKCMEGGHPVFFRPSLGFYHPNFTMLFDKEKTTIRLTLGLDPDQVDLLAETFKMIDILNDPSPLITQDNFPTFTHCQY